MKNLIVKRMLAGLCASLILAGGIVGGASAFASNTTNEEKIVIAKETQQAQKKTGRAARQEEMKSLFTQYAPELLSKYTALEAELDALQEANKPKLDDATKAKLDAFMQSIKQKLANNEMTKQEAQTAIKDFMTENNIEMPVRLDDQKDRTFNKGERTEPTPEVKAFMDSIKTKVDGGEMTKEEAQEAIKNYMTENNIQMPVRPEGQTDDKFIKGERPALNPELKAFMDSIKAKIDSGEITKEDAQEAIHNYMEENNIASPKHQDGKNALKTAIENKDAATIKTFLEEQIQRMEDRLDKMKAQQ